MLQQTLNARPIHGYPGTLPADQPKSLASLREGEIYDTSNEAKQSRCKATWRGIDDAHDGGLTYQTKAAQIV